MFEAFRLVPHAMAVKRESIFLLGAHERPTRGEERRVNVRSWFVRQLTTNVPSQVYM